MMLLQRMDRLYRGAARDASENRVPRPRRRPTDGATATIASTGTGVVSSLIGAHGIVVTDKVWNGLSSCQVDGREGSLSDVRRK
jgi:hypothetical protein